LLCLKSLKQLKSTQFHLEIIVVDNASTDDSVSQIRLHYPDIILLNTEKNLGFTGANNLGITKALSLKSDYIWILNNDTVVDPYSLEYLVKTFKDRSVGIAGSKIYFMKHHEYHASRYKESELGKVLWYAGGLIDWNNVYGSHRGVDEVDIGQYDQDEETPFVTGCSMLISKECIEVVGGFDNKYFAFLEDVDLCIKAQYAGFKVMYISRSVVWHKNAGSTGGPGNTSHQYYMTRNRILLGLRFASLRTKLALMRESFRFLFKGTATQKKAVKDAILSRWGENE
jgi:GT2 family glycosyltransferase